MGKKNKNSKPKNNLEVVEKKGGSVVSKGKNDILQKKKPVNQKPVIKKLVEEKKIEVNKNLGKKKKGGNNKKKDSAPAKEEKTLDQESEKITKLSKREKNRIKSKMAKDIAMDGKSKLGLADPKLVARQLNKLKTSSEPLSKNKQRKMVLLEKLDEKLKKKETKTPNTSMVINASSVAKDANTSDSSNKADANKGKHSAKREKDKLFLFIGNLPSDVTEEMIRDTFKSAGVVETVRIPVPKRKKSKRFAYIKLENEECKQKALQMHGTLMGERKVTVLLSDKSKGKNALMSANAKLLAERKAAEPKSSIPATNGSPKKSTMKNKKKGGKAIK